MGKKIDSVKAECLSGSWLPDINTSSGPGSTQFKNGLISSVECQLFADKIEEKNLQ
jgi:hypothetical protein